MSKTDLRARPMFPHTRQAIAAHLTEVFTALAVARYMQTRTGVSLKRSITTPETLTRIHRHIGDHEITFPEIPTRAQYFSTNCTSKPEMGYLCKSGINVVKSR